MKTKYFVILGVFVLLGISILIFLPQETITITELPAIKLPSIVIP